MTKEQIHEAVHTMGRKARAAAHGLAQPPRAAAHGLAQLSSNRKNEVLQAMAAELRAREGGILAANAEDLAAASEKGLSGAMLDRLRLDGPRLAAMAEGIEQVALLDDPVGQVIAAWERPNGMSIEQVRVPIGVIGIVYESRPNVTSDAAVLCFKTGNATILRGGSEAIHSNRAITGALQQGGAKAGLPDDSIQLIPFADRESVAAMAGMDRWLDLIIPRGGKGLIETVVSLARMPVIKHYDGICHTYVDAAADLEMAVALCVDAKTQKPGVCNAMETMLVHRDVAPGFLPKAAAALRAKGVELRGDDAVRQILGSGVVPATEDDWRTEYLDLILSIKVVGSLDEAVHHINEHGSHHSDCIVTGNQSAAGRFMREVDSACVFHNVSTRFNDGGEFGFGAEIGISTDKLHARGPMALRELTSYQYRVRGSGQTRGR